VNLTIKVFLLICYDTTDTISTKLNLHYNPKKVGHFREQVIFLFLLQNELFHLEGWLFPYTCVVCLYVTLFLCLSVCLFVCLSVCLFVCLSVCLFVCLSVCLFVCLSVCLLTNNMSKVNTID
jgi:hypothetical protein